MRAARRERQIGPSLERALRPCPRCGEAPPARLTVELGYGPELAWMLPGAIRRVHHIAATCGYGVHEVYRGRPDGLPIRPMSGQEAPRAHFAVMRLTRPGVPDAKPGDDNLSEGDASEEEEEAAVIDWPWLSNYRRLLEWGSGRSNVHACHEPDFPGFRPPPPA